MTGERKAFAAISQSAAEEREGNTGAGPVLQSVLSLADLRRRPTRRPQYASENRALLSLAQELATSPVGVLRKLAETAMTLCRAQSAGVSLLNDDRKSFYWPVIVGKWACLQGSGTPRDYGPCGTVLDRKAALLFLHPERDFDYLTPVTPLIEEALLVPFYVSGEAIGTIWVIVHDGGRRFDANDLRLMTDLATFAGAAYQTLLSLDTALQNASIIASSDDAIVSKDLNGIITGWNNGAARLFGYLREEVIGKPITMLIPEDRRHEELDILARIGRGERVEHYETIRQCKQGTLIDISLTVSPHRNVEGKIIGASKIARDITERKQADERLGLLAFEADHRSKNLLTVVEAAVHLAQADNVASLKQAIKGRIHALAIAHTLLSESRWAGADLYRLVSEELSPYRRDGEGMEIDGPSQMLKPGSAQSIAMVLHELTTNAVKYGALSLPTGRVQVTWGAAVEGRLVIRWSEMGGPAVATPKHQGFGTRFIKRWIGGESDGEAHFDWRVEGLLCEITVSV